MSKIFVGLDKHGIVMAAVVVDGNNQIESDIADLVKSGLEIKTVESETVTTGQRLPSACIPVPDQPDILADLQKLFCVWCPQDCQGLTEEERKGCLASGGFIDTYKAKWLSKCGDRERIAELEHIQWQSWAKARNPEHPLVNVSYSELTEAQKDQDRIWADKVISTLRTEEEVKAEERKKMIADGYDTGELPVVFSSC